MKSQFPTPLAPEIKGAHNQQAKEGERTHKPKRKLTVGLYCIKSPPRAISRAREKFLGRATMFLDQRLQASRPGQTGCMDIALHDAARPFHLYFFRPPHY